MNDGVAAIGIKARYVHGHASPLSLPDRLLGAAFGLLRGLVLLEGAGGSPLWSGTRNRREFRTVRFTRSFYVSAASAPAAICLKTRISPSSMKIWNRITPARVAPMTRNTALTIAGFGLLLLAATYVFLSVLGGSLSPIYPLVYALVSFLVSA